MIQNKKIIIEGSFWDSYIYSNNLFLFGRDKTLKSYRWDEFVKSHVYNETDRLAYRCAFYQSDFLYGIKEKELFNDSEIKKIMLDKFNRIQDIHVSENDLSPFKTFNTTIEFPHLTIDIGVFKNKLYYCDSSGLFFRNIRNNNKNAVVSSRANKCWDAYIQCLKINNYGRVALSASSDGLFELNTKYDNELMYIKFKKVEEKIFQLTDRHSSYCCWAFSSVLNCSYLGDVQLLGFKYVNNDFNDYLEEGMNFIEEYDGNGIFENINNLGSDSIIISENEKLYKISSKLIEGVEYHQKYLGTNEEIFKPILMRLQELNDEIIDAAVVEFGVVVETKRFLHVLLSTGEDIFTINKNQEDIVRWRVFPRSTCYVNQLHVIYDNRIEIISFNDDYFINQKDKKIGNRFYDSKKIY